MCYKICYFQKDARAGTKFFNKENLLKMGFSVETVCGKCQNAFEYFSKNRVDILIIDATGVDKERLALAVDIIYNNYCKNILIVASEKFGARDDIYFLTPEDMENIDLKIDTVLLDIKRKQEGMCSKTFHLSNLKFASFC